MITQNGNVPTAEQNSLPGGMAAATAVSEGVMEIIWRGKWIVLISTVAIATAAMFYIVNATPIYTSTSRVYVEQSGPKIVGDLEEGVMTQSKNYLYTQAALMGSTPILSAALEKPGIKDFRIFSEMDNKTIFLKERGLDIRVGRKDDIISVSSDSPNPAEAAQLVNAVVDAYITYHATTKRSTSAEVLKILQDKIGERNQELTDKLKAMMDFKRKNEALAFQSTHGNVILQRLERLSTELTDAQMATVDAKARYDAINEMVSDPAKVKQFIDAQRSRGSYAVGATDERVQLRAKLEDLELRLADRRRQVKDHPAVEAIETEIEQVSSEILELDHLFAQGHLAVAKEEYDAAQQKQAEIERYFEEQRKEVLTLNEQEAGFTILQSEYDQTKQLCDTLDLRIKELNITEDVGALNITILEVARPADDPSRPEKAKILAVAILFGLASGCGLAVARSVPSQRTMGQVGIREGLRLKVFPACRKYLEIGDFDSIMGL